MSDIREEIRLALRSPYLPDAIDRLAAVGDQRRIARHEPLPQLRVAGLGVGERQAVEDAQRPLAEIAIELERQPGGGGDGLGGLDRADQRAAVDPGRRDPAFRQRLAGRAGLLAAEEREGATAITELPAGERVAVTDEGQEHRPLREQERDRTAAGRGRIDRAYPDPARPGGAIRGRPRKS